MEYESLFKAARQAGTLLAETETERLGRTLMHAAQLLRTHTPRLLEANARDLEAMAPDSPLRDRLRLTPERIAAIAADMEAVAHLPSPQGEELERRTRPNGMTIVKRRVPFGVVGMICEARPNVTADIFSLCIKTGNACVLKGGGDARHSNEAIAALLHEALRSESIDEHAFTLLPSDHASVGALLNAVGYVDVVIPRGGAGLIRACVENATVPCIETGTGICHVYVDKAADLAKAVSIIVNAKASRPSVCNAEEVCLVHRDVAAQFLPLLKKAIVDDRAAAGLVPVELRLDEAAAEIIPGTAATELDFDTEFLDYILAVAVVDDLDAAIAHVQHHSTHHSDCIVTENQAAADRFVDEVDSAAVYVNVSTRFTDGGEFGLGCEMGISTQKLHARGPMGLDELSTYKYVITGSGQIR